MNIPLSALIGKTVARIERRDDKGIVSETGGQVLNVWFTDGTVLHVVASLLGMTVLRVYPVDERFEKVSPR